MTTPLKVVVVGCGGISGAWMPTVTQLADLQVVGLVDLRRETAEALAAKHGLPASVVYGSLTEALAKAKPDVVFDLTVPGVHDKVAIEALAAGCNVLGEKPMSDDLAKAQRMVQSAHKAAKVYAVIQNRRYEPNIRAVRKTIDSGAIGAVQELHSDFYIGAHFGGFRDVMEDVLIVDMAIHTFDAARFISGADPVSVYCQSWNPAHSWYKGHASAMCIFEMSSGIVYSYRGSWCAEGLGTTWECDWRIIGAKGTIRWDGAKDIRCQAVKPDGKHGFTSEMVDVPVVPEAMEHIHHAAQIRDYVDCLKTGRTPQTICDDNIRSFAMVIAAVESRKKGQKVPVTW